MSELQNQRRLNFLKHPISSSLKLVKQIRLEHKEKLDKKLTHSELEFFSKPNRKAKSIIKFYKSFLKIESHRLKTKHEHFSDEIEVARKRSELYAVFLSHLWKHISSKVLLKEKELPPFAIFAVGGFGRYELNPQSDIDILFVHQENYNNAITEKIIKEMMYILWDMGLKIGHATRTITEIISLSNEDLRTKTSMLECHFLCGDITLWENFQNSFQKQCIEDKKREYIQWRFEDQDSRHEKYGNTVFVQEPNLKNGCGGLRDYQNLLWVARVEKGYLSTADLEKNSLLTSNERKLLDNAYKFILRLRSKLHYLQKRGGDTLTLPIQGKIANRSGYRHKHILRRIEALMRDYYEHANSIYTLTASLTEHIAQIEKPQKKNWFFLNKKNPSPKIIDDIFILEKGVLEAKHNEIFQEDPTRLIYLFLIAQKHDAEISAELNFLVRRHVKLINRSVLYNPIVSKILLNIMSHKGKVGRIFRIMHEMRLLGRIFPEFAPLTCLVQHEFFHRYTADEHTLVCIEMLDKIINNPNSPFNKYEALMKSIDHPYILYLSMLLHDTGKSDNQSTHSEKGAENAIKVARRMKLDIKDVSTIVFLVDNHLIMSNTSRRKNIDDQECILKFARIAETSERLNLLMLLTFADTQGTRGDENQTAWNESLIWLLFYRTKRAIEDGQEFQLLARKSTSELFLRLSKSLSMESKTLGFKISKEEIEAHFNLLPESYFYSTQEYLIKNHLLITHKFLHDHLTQSTLQPIIQWIDHPEGGYSEASIVTWNREHFFTKITGAFATRKINILSADVFTRKDNIIIDTFKVSTEQQRAVTRESDKKEVEKIIKKAFSPKGFPFHSFFKEKNKNPLYPIEDIDFPVRIKINQDASQEYTLLEVESVDQIGILYTIAHCLTEMKIEIALARITTEKGAAFDSFYLTDEKGAKIHSKEITSKIVDNLKAILSPTSQPSEMPSSLTQS